MDVMLAVGICMCTRGVRQPDRISHEECAAEPSLAPCSMYLACNALPVLVRYVVVVYW